MFHTYNTKTRLALLSFAEDIQDIIFEQFNETNDYSVV